MPCKERYKYNFSFKQIKQQQLTLNLHQQQFRSQSLSRIKATIISVCTSNSFSTLSTFLDQQRGNLPGSIAIMKPSLPYILKSIKVSKVEDQKRQSFIGKNKSQKGGRLIVGQTCLIILSNVEIFFSVQMILL